MSLWEICKIPTLGVHLPNKNPPWSNRKLLLVSMVPLAKTRVYPSMSRTKLILIPVLLHLAQLVPRHTKSSWFLKSQTLPRTIHKTFNCKYHLVAETTLFIWVPSTWDLQKVNQLKLYLILAPNTWPSPLRYVMTRPPETSSLRSMIHYPVPLSKGINWTKDAKPKLTTCTNPIPIRSCQKPHQSWHMVPLSFRVSSGKTTPAFNHWTKTPRV